MNTVKPIVVIYYYQELLVTNGGKKMGITEVNEIFKEMFPEYYTLAIPSNLSTDGSCEDIRLQVFYEKDFTPIQYEELKKMVQESLPKPKANT